MGPSDPLDIRRAHLDRELGFVERLFDEERYAEAESVCAELAVEFPDSARPLLEQIHAVILGTPVLEWTALLQEKRLMLAAEAVRREPMNHEAWHELGSVRSAISDLEDAVAAFERSLDLCPSVDSVCGLAIALTELGRKDEALRLLYEAGSRFSDDDYLLCTRDDIVNERWD